MRRGDRRGRGRGREFLSKEDRFDTRNKSDIGEQELEMNNPLQNEIMPKEKITEESTLYYHKNL